MPLFDYYLRYMTEVWEGTRPAPEGITLPEGGDENARIQALGQQLQDMGMAAFVRACAAQDGTVLPEEPKAATLAVLSCFFKTRIRHRKPLPRRKSPRPPTPMPTSTPLRCFWTALPWTTVLCSI